MMMEHQDIYVGPEGVAAGGILGNGVEDLFVVSGSAPHLTLAVGSHHLPAELGAHGGAGDWRPNGTLLTTLTYIGTGKVVCIEFLPLGGWHRLWEK